MDEFCTRCNRKNRRFTGGKSRFLQEADWVKFAADVAAELCGIALVYAYEAIRKTAGMSRLLPDGFPSAFSRLPCGNPGRAAGGAGVHCHMCGAEVHCRMSSDSIYRARQDCRNRSVISMVFANASSAHRLEKPYAISEEGFL